MASSPKKAPRPAVKLEQPSFEAVEPAPVAVEADVSVAALQAAEESASVAEIVETPAEAAAPVALPAPVVSVEAAEPPAPAKALGENVRAFVEKRIVESRAKFAEAKTAAEEASAAVEASYGAAREGVVAFNVKAIEAWKAGAEANFDLIVSVASARSVSELVTLQSEFARKRFEAASSQAKELAELARKVADQTVAPIKAQLAKTFKTAV